jgi:uncharacterized protein (DUF1800 family)
MPTLTRKGFFAILWQKTATTTVENPKPDVLFERYARKKYGARVYDPLLTKNPNDPKKPERIGNVTSGLAPYNGVWTTWEVLHLLRRSGFGFEKNDADTLQAMGVDSAVNAILSINTTAPPPPVNWYDNFFTDENTLPYGADWTNDAFATNSIGNTTNGYRNDALRRWSLGLMLNQENNIREKMTWFWLHFIPIDFRTVLQSPNQYASTNSARICYQYTKMYRDNALGNFKTMVRNMATQPAMMFYLNNQANAAASPDENFARELMELFTLGKHPMTQYTQNDVVEAAKVLTGWRVQNLNTTTQTTNFVSAQHKTGSKQFSSFFNNTVINNTGASELDALIDMIFDKQQIVSEYICRRLYRYFVYYDIDANIEANVIVPLAQTFVANNWNILPVLQQLFKSEHFFDVANRGVYIKSPLDLVVGCLRCFGLNHNVADATNHEAQYRIWSYFNDTVLAPIDQSIGRVPNVAGYPAFYQAPSYHEYWINSNTTQKRFDFLQRIFNGYNRTYNGLTTRIEVDVINFVQQFGSNIIADPDLLVSECIKYLLPVDLSVVQKDVLKFQTLLSNQTTNSYWTNAWQSYMSNPTDAQLKAQVQTRLKSLLTTITQYAEFQLM